MHHYYNHPHYYRRSPRRLFWFLLGGVTFTLWQYCSNKNERNGLSWNRQCRRVTDREQPTRFNESSSQTGYLYTSNDMIPRRENDEENRVSEPLWKLRSEKEAERRQREQEAEYRDDLLRAREAVLSATESGLQSLQKSLDSLTKLVQDQRRERSGREVSPAPKEVKKD